VVGPIIAEVLKAHPGLEAPRLAHETVRRMIDRMVRDLLDETRRRIASAKPDSAAAVRALDHPLVAFSDQLVAESKALRGFLFDNMYRHHRVNLMTAKARRVVGELFNFYIAEPQTLPAEWQAQLGAPRSPETARLIADYIAGMTDRYALREHRRIFELEVG
jgi:dGTPase